MDLQCQCAFRFKCSAQVKPPSQTGPWSRENASGNSNPRARSLAAEPDSAMCPVPGPGPDRYHRLGARMVPEPGALSQPAAAPRRQQSRPVCASARAPVSLQSHWHYTTCTVTPMLQPVSVTVLSP